VGESRVLGPRDEAVVAGQLGRQPRDVTGIPVRCPFGHPAVIETAPLLSDGAPNPTLLYLTCPAMVAAVSRAEAGGGVRELKSACGSEERLRAHLNGVTRLYQERRAELAAELAAEPAGGGATTARRAARLEAGIGGPERPEVASCLHAYAAAWLAVMSGWLGGEAESPLSADARRAWARFLPPPSDCWCTDRRCSRWVPGERRAAIDVGTISVRLLVADVGEGRPQTVVRRAEVTRLGEGLLPGAPLTVAARGRTATVVSRFAREARAQGAGAVILAGTSAAREALDGEEFIQALGRDHGIDAFVLTGRREAELAYAGACLDLPGEPVVLLDVGGGSTELICRSGTGELQVISLALGASRATDAWILSDPPQAAEAASIHREATHALEGVSAQFSSSGAPNRRLVGVAGTVTTLACLDAGLEKYDAEFLHLRELSLEAVRHLTTELSVLTTAQRAALPCIQPGRAPVIVGGAVIVLAAMETLGYERLTVSERDLLDGLLLLGA
jgi:exopolyphosphatase/guanosine-5'-triphosphate,3'-diphosphate pyrophosphatase